MAGMRWVNIQNSNPIDGLGAVQMFQEIDGFESFHDLFGITQMDPAIEVHTPHLWRIASSWQWRPLFDGPRHLR